MSSQFSQSGLPTGSVGRFVGWIMQWHNRTDNLWAISLLEARSNDSILEVGFGPGQAINFLSKANRALNIAGIEHSETMLKAARQLNRAEIAAGKVQLHLGKAEKLPFADESFDRALSINCIYFWKAPITGLIELYRVLKPGGCLVITVRDSDSEAYEGFQPEDLMQLAKSADFTLARVHRNAVPSHPLLALVATK